MIDIKHIRQVNDGFNWKCGAACLEMIFSYYGISKNQDDIWNATSSSRGIGKGQKFILTKNLARYSCENGLSATIYKASADKWSELLDKLSEKQIPAILSLRQKKTSQSHFVVYKGINNNKYCFCDPDEERESILFDYATMKDIWKPQPIIDVTGYIFICFGTEEETVICNSCQHRLPIVHKWISKYLQGIICPNCDKFV